LLLKASFVAEYKVIISRPASKALEQLPASVVARVFPRIEELARDPYPRGSKKLQGLLPLWRIRVGDYRVIYSVDRFQKVVKVTAVRHRSKAYARP
jgi:mRNA interferase RelE/StbE